MGEVKREIERRNPVHRALHLLLQHQSISQPEVGQECADLTDKLDAHFAKEMVWDAAAAAQTEKKEGD